MTTGNTITALAENGTISPSGVVSVPYNTTQVFTYAANEGYVLYEIWKNGVFPGNNSTDYKTFAGSYSFLYSTALNLSLRVVFGTAYGRINTSVGYHGYVYGSDMAAVVAGYHPDAIIEYKLTDSIKTGTASLYTVVPNAGYVISGVWINGQYYENWNGQSGTIPLVVGHVNNAVSTPYTFELNANPDGLILDNIKPIDSIQTLQVLFAVGSYNIVSSVVANGTISPLGTTSVALGASKTYTLTPASGYGVATLLIDGVAVTPTTSYTFSNVNSNHTILATFSNTTKYITATAGTGGTISPSGTVSVSIGSSQTFTFTPTTGYSIFAVMVDGVAVRAVSPYTFNAVTANHAIYVGFAMAVSTNNILAVSNIGSTASKIGGVIIPEGNISVKTGGNQSFSMVPNAGYTLDFLQVDGVLLPVVPYYTFNNVITDHNILISFKLIDFSITASAGANGSISPAGNVAVTKGTNKSFVITPNENCKISDVLIDGVSAGAVSTYTFTNVQMEHSIAAVFLKEVYTIISAAGANGTITPLGTTTLEYGDDQSFVITPDEDYVIQDIIIDGVSVDMPSTGILFIND